VAASLAWAFGVSALLALVLVGALPSLVAEVHQPDLTVPGFVAPVDLLVSYLCVSYFLLVVAYVEAHVAVARGLVTVPKRRGVPVTRVRTPEKA
jgi:hypothetical protein